jgi:hypothetical protein
MVQVMRMSEKPTSINKRPKVPLFILVHLLLIPTNKDTKNPSPLTHNFFLLSALDAIVIQVNDPPFFLKYRNMGKSKWGRYCILR